MMVVKDSQAVVPSWLNLVNVTTVTTVITGVESELVVNNSDRTSVGIYTVTIAASIHQVLEANQTKQINFSFTLVVKDECEKSVFDSTKVINDMFAKVS